MKVSELIALLSACDQDVEVNYVNENGCFLDIEFVENRLESSPGWGATVSLYEGRPDWSESEDYEVEEISADYVSATTKYHDFVTM
jgi:hypothetical protein